MTKLTHEPIDPAALTEHVRSPLAGAVCVFLGTVRELTGDRITTHLHYDAYPAMVEKELSSIEQEACTKWPLTAMVIVHRVGRLDVGEISVGVAVSSPHRADAFAAAQFAIDTLKARVPIWKKEHGPDGQFWVSDRP